MKSLQLLRYGAIAESVGLREATLSPVGDDDVLIEVHAASINPIDYKFVSGELRRVNKMDGMKFPAALGFDASGVVVSVGHNVTQFTKGDEVYTRAPREKLGAFAEQMVVETRFVAHKPHNLTHLEAASLPLVGLTTVQALKDRAQAKRAQAILIHAGAGGVGTFAIQYAKTLGLRVTTTTSSKNAAWVKALGADKVIEYDRENYLAGGESYQIVYDTLGGKYTLEAFTALKRNGVVVSIAGPPDKDMARVLKAGPLARAAMWWMSRKVYAAAQERNASYYRFLTESNGAQLADIAQLVEAGKIKPVIDSVHPFAEIIPALEHAATGQVKGKVVVQMKA